MTGKELGQQPAFPKGEWDNGPDGMTKRELFAGLAMQRIILQGEWHTIPATARKAVHYADALLEELAKET